MKPLYMCLLVLALIVADCHAKVKKPKKSDVETEEESASDPEDEPEIDPEAEEKELEEDEEKVEEELQVEDDDPEDGSARKKRSLEPTLMSILNPRFTREISSHGGANMKSASGLKGKEMKPIPGPK